MSNIKTRHRQVAQSYGGICRPLFEELERRLLLSTVPEGAITGLWTDVNNSQFAATVIGYALAEHGSTFGQASSLMNGAISSILASLPGSFDASADVTFSVGIEAEASLGIPGASRQLASLGTGYNLTYSGLDADWTLSRYTEFSLIGVDISAEYFATFDSILSVSSTDWVTFGVTAAVGAGTDDAIQVGQLLRAGIEAGVSGDVSITAETNLRVDDFLNNYVDQPSFAEGLADVFIPYYGDTWWENLLTGAASFVPILPLEQLLDLTKTDTPLGILAHSGSVDVSVDAGFDVSAGVWFGVGGEVPVAPGLNVGGQIFVGVSLSAGVGVELWSQSYSGWEPVEPELVLPEALSYSCSAVPSTHIDVTFNKDIDMSSVSSSSVHVTGSRSGSHSATFSFDAPSNVLTINSSWDFYWDETVTVVLDREIRDTSGHEMASDVSFSFDIGQQPVFPASANLSNVSVSPCSNVIAYSPITVSGAFTYDTGAPVLAGTVTINTGDNTYTAAISNGTFSRVIDAPGSDRNVSITAIESEHGWIDSSSVHVTVEDPTNGNGYIFARSTTCRDVGADPYNPIYETEYFRRTDDKAVVWLHLEHLEIPVRAKWEFYEPDGDLHRTEVGDWTDDPTDYGYDYYYWWKLWGWVDIDGYAASYEPGQWTVDVYIDDGGGWDYTTTETLYLGCDFTEHRTAQNVQSFDPYLPIGETNVFYTDDDRALTWANADDVSESFEVRWEFYEPNGSRYNTFDHTTSDPGADSYYDWYRFWGWVDIDGALAAQKPGEWHVDVSIKEPNGSYDWIYTDYFQILERPATAPTVAVTPSIADPIETQSFSLSVSASDNTYLEDVTLYWDDGSLHTRQWTDLYSGSKNESVSVGPYGAGQQIQYWAVATDTSGNTYESPRRTLVVQPETVSAPTAPSGPTTCEPNQTVSFTTSGSTTSLGGVVEYQFDWGDGQLSSWGPASQEHAWADVASCPVRTRARSQVRPGRVSNWSEVGLVNVALSVPGGLNAVSVSSSEIDLSWTDNSAQEDGFRIERKVASGTWTEINTVAADVSSYRDLGLSDQIEYLYRVRAFSSAGNSPFSNEASATTDAVGEVVDRHVFYNASAWDWEASADTNGNGRFDSGEDGADDDNAIALDKAALLPGETATFANYTSYSRGINGIIIDIDGLAGTPGTGDFVFRAGNDSNPGAWTAAPDPSSITVRAGGGVGGSDRVTIIWADNNLDDVVDPNEAVAKQWLQVTVLSDDNGGHLGLAEDDVFYFGNAVGETGDSIIDAKVNATDKLGARNNPHTFLDPALIDDRYDFDRDQKVNATDELIARNNGTTFLTDLELITVPAAGGGGAEPMVMLPLAPELAVVAIIPAQETRPAVPVADTEEAVAFPKMSPQLVETSGTSAVANGHHPVMESGNGSNVSPSSFRDPVAQDAGGVFELARPTPQAGKRRTPKARQDRPVKILREALVWAARSSVGQWMGRTSNGGVIDADSASTEPTNIFDALCATTGHAMLGTKAVNDPAIGLELPRISRGLGPSTWDRPNMWPSAFRLARERAIDARVDGLAGALELDLLSDLKAFAIL